MTPADDADERFDAIRTCAEEISRDVMRLTKSHADRIGRLKDVLRELYKAAEDYNPWDPDQRKRFLNALSKAKEVLGDGE